MNNLFSAEGEDAVITGLLNHAVGGLAVIEGFNLSSKDFLSDDKAAIFALVKQYLQETAGSSVDQSIIRFKAKAANIPLDVELLDTLSTNHVNITDLTQYAKTVKTCSLIRSCKYRAAQLVDNLSKLTLENTYGDLCKIHDAANRDISNILAGASGSDFKHIYTEVEDLLNEIIQGKQQVGLVCNGFPHWMASIGGSLRMPSLNVISAEAKAGKSALCLAAGSDIAQQGYPVLYIDTELERSYQACRLIANRSGVPLKRVEYGSYINDPHDNDKVVSEIKTGKSVLAIDHYPCSGFLLEDVLVVIQRWIITKVGRKPDGTAKDCLVVFDYLKCSTEREYVTNMSEFQILGLVMTKLHDLAKQYRLPILMAAQLNVDTGVVGSSRRIDDLCSNRIVLTRKNPEEISFTGQFGNRKLSVARSRFVEPHHPSDYLHFNLNPNNGSFTEGGWHSEVSKQLSIPVKTSSKGNHEKI